MRVQQGSDEEPKLSPNKPLRRSTQTSNRPPPIGHEGEGAGGMELTMHNKRRFTQRTRALDETTLEEDDDAILGSAKAYSNFKISKAINEGTTREGYGILWVELTMEKKRRLRERRREVDAIAFEPILISLIAFGFG
ncbi:uncharacterized protein G2W53_002807 [Senna tora]|uniref:Uncharacterized protein n=1 Tax=Senna tora TaxID=362788 RepID=A0A835CFR5_9FABA|nr:uncharacterized protein G2W53_002807 [Senna tora]